MPVLLCNDINLDNLKDLLARYGMQVKKVSREDSIPGSFWQEPEAGLVGNLLYVRDDTPVHSALHEACHYICMDRQRRNNLDTEFLPRGKRFRNAIDIIVVRQGNGPQTGTGRFGNQLGGGQGAVRKDAVQVEINAIEHSDTTLMMEDKQI